MRRIFFVTSLILMLCRIAMAEEIKNYTLDISKVNYYMNTMNLSMIMCTFENKKTPMRLIYKYLAFILSIIYSSCESKDTVCINSICESYADGTPIELYYLLNDSVINVGNDTLIHGGFNFTIDANLDIAYYVSVNDSQNPSRGMLFAEKGTVNIAFDPTYHVSGTPHTISLRSFYI